MYMPSILAGLEYGIVLMPVLSVLLLTQRRGVEGLAGFFTRQFLGRQSPQLVVDQRQQLLRGVRIALLDGGQNAGDFIHGRHGV